MIMVTDQTWTSSACYEPISEIGLCMNKDDKVVFTQFMGFVLLELMHKISINLKWRVRERIFKFVFSPELRSRIGRGQSERTTGWKAWIHSLRIPHSTAARIETGLSSTVEIKNVWTKMRKVGPLNGKVSKANCLKQLWWICFYLLSFSLMKKSNMLRTCLNLQRR